MTFRPIVRALVVPVLGLSLSKYGKRPTLAEGEPAAPGHKVVNINQATGAELVRLPGIGDNTASRIVLMRQLHGPFKRPEDLMQVPGIGERTFAALRPYVAVSGPTTAHTKIKHRL